jgi:phage shock protein A
MMPYILSLIGRTCDFSTFHAVMTTWNFPQLFMNPPPEKIIRELREQLEYLQNERQVMHQENENLRRSMLQMEQEIGKLKNSITKLQGKRPKLYNY